MKYRYWFIGLVAVVSFGRGEQVLTAQTGYQLPPASVVNIIDADPVPGVRISPDGQWILQGERSAMPSIADLSRRMLRLAGMRIDPVANGPFTTFFTRSVALRKIEGGTPVLVELPADAQIADINWSHRSNAFLITTVSTSGSKLWAVSVMAPSDPKLVVDDLHRVTTGISWMPDGQSVICSVVPAGRGVEPAEPAAPTGPNVQESSGQETPTRTYQDLLSTAHDEALFDFYATSQLQHVQLDGTRRDIGQPAIFSAVSLSPNGRYLLVSKIKRPYSYLLTMGSFPHDIEVWNVDGQLIHQVAEVPIEENIPIEGVRTGPRNVTWRANQPATLAWAEALDGGDPRTTVKHRDRVLALTEPFDQAPLELVRVEHRFFGLTEMADAKFLVTTEYDRDRRWIRTLKYHLDQPSAEPVVLMDRSIRDVYGDPGRLLTRELENGQRVVRQDGDWVYRLASGASPIGNLPFLDRQNLTTLKTERLWRCSAGCYEDVAVILDSGTDRKPIVVSVKESPELPPNYHWTDLNSGETRALTKFPDPTPQIRGIKKQLVTYQRADGVPLSATLYLPADHQPGTMLPLLVWAYPLEFSDAKTAGQVSDSPWRFTQMPGISHLTLVTQGYAVMDNATMPVIGDPETMNDTFVEQIVAAAQAAIDKAVELGVADRNRVAVGGHSYGAFMTANLLAHCDLFKAGVARSGAYNRTLTPFGFQAERRNFWEAKEIYLNLSPFSHADKINEPILLIHGEADNNPGTFPIQSQRMYQAVKGTGGTVRLVMLPFESHGYQARESVLHTQAEMIQWLDKYVKHAGGSPP